MSNCNSYEIITPEQAWELSHDPLETVYAVAFDDYSIPFYEVRRGIYQLNAGIYTDEELSRVLTIAEEHPILLIRVKRGEK